MSYSLIYSLKLRRKDRERRKQRKMVDTKGVRREVDNSEKTCAADSGDTGPSDMGGQQT